MEWESVRRAQAELDRARERLENLRGQQSNMTQLLDGMPRSQRLGSHLEELAIKILEAEAEIKVLEQKVLHLQDLLTEYIFTAIVDAKMQKIMFLRYVRCLSFKKIAGQMYYSQSRIKQLHDEYMALYGLNPC